MNATEQYIAAVQRIEQRAQRRAGEVWRQYKHIIASELDRYGPRANALLSALTGAVLRAAGELPNTSIDSAIYNAAAAVVAGQVGGVVLGEYPTPMMYDAWRSTATGTLVGEAIRMQLAGADDAAMRARLITGKDGRSSAWELARTSLALAVAMLVWGAANGTVVRLGRAVSERDGVEYQKQAIAALDARTTRICRAVNRQIRPLDKPFETLAGPIMNPPFHYNCRTAVVLYHPSFED